MNTSAHARMKLPDEQEVQLAARGQRALASCLSGKRKTRRVQLFDEADRAHEMELSISTLRLVEEILNGLAKGDAIRVVSVNAELTTQEAADLLNVSRPHLVKLLEDGELAFLRTGKHRRVRLADLLQFKDAREQASVQAMDELSRQAQELGMGYE
ncbi:helix-turn-helix domain-containing protein [Pigmentiphaga daeguensis]|uniref:Helix-turn-helix domain-containing protein n=1 Tax=Pigmentiphaga daeguensis TaxID=414049 RepID=A0ABN1C786_9BURK